jgi:hypothetical protein
MPGPYDDDDDDDGSDLDRGFEPVDQPDDDDDDWGLGY